MVFLYCGSYPLPLNPTVGLKEDYLSQLQVQKNTGYVSYRLHISCKFNFIMSFLIIIRITYLFHSLNLKGSKEKVLKDLLLLMMLQSWRLLKLVN